jgi:polar amino acid transport system substrate-binding protein
MLDHKSVGETMTFGQGLMWRLGALAWLAVTLAGPAAAQSPDTPKAFAPTGTLRVGVLMVTYFALPDRASGGLTGVVPDLGRELARRLDVPAQLIRYENPVAVIEAFRKGELDATFIGITADRAAAFDFGPVVLDLQTTYLVPAASTITSIDEIDRPDVRLLVPARSAQEAFLKKTIAKATMISVAVENPRAAVEKLAAGEADAFSHVVPMLVSAQAALPGSRILPGSYYNVPIAIGYAKERSAAVAAFAKAFAEDVKKSGFVRQSLDRAGDSVKGVVVATQ